VAATVGIIIAAVYLLWAYQQVFHGEPTERDKETRDLGWSERLVIAPLILLIVFLGVYPKPVLDRITPSVNQLIAHVDQVTHTQQPAVATGGGSAATGAGPIPRAGTRSGSGSNAATGGGR
jgi:NADH-quinone oxidoreductase subunit M